MVVKPAWDSGTGRGVGFEKYGTRNRQGLVTGVQGQPEGIPGVGGQVDGHIAGGAQKEELWEFWLFKHPWVSGSGHRLSVEVVETTIGESPLHLVLQRRVPGRVATD